MPTIGGQREKGADESDVNAEVIGPGDVTLAPRAAVRPVIARNLGASEQARRARTSLTGSVFVIDRNINGTNKNEVFSKDSAIDIGQKTRARSPGVMPARSSCVATFPAIRPSVANVAGPAASRSRMSRSDSMAARLTR